MPRLNRWFTFFFIGIAFVIGLFIGKLITDFPVIELEKKVDFVGIFNSIIAAITLAVAFYIAHILDRKKKKEEYAFQFITKKIDDLKDEVKNLILAISGKEIPVHIVNSKLKNISLSFIDLKEIMSFMDMEISKDDNGIILKLIRHLKILCTEVSVYKFNTNIIAYTDERELTISEGNIKFTPKRIEEVKVYSKKIVNKVFYLITK